MGPLRVQVSVLGLVGVEVGTGRLEIWRLAFAKGMDVEGVLARRDGCQVEADQDSARIDGQRGLANLLATCVLEHGRRLIDGEGGRKQRETTARWGCRPNTSASLTRVPEARALPIAHR